MRVFVLTFSLLIAWSSAQAGQALTFELIEHGLYERGEAANEQPPTATNFGRASFQVKHSSTTRKVPARQHATFGFRYRIVGPPAGEVLETVQVTLLPPPGAKSPVGEAPFTRTVVPQFEYAGVESGWFFSFDYLWEMVPGIWRIQIWSGQQKLTEQPFEVYVPPSA